MLYQAIGRRPAARVLPPCILGILLRFRIGPGRGNLMMADTALPAGVAMRAGVVLVAGLALVVAVVFLYFRSRADRQPGKTSIFGIVSFLFLALLFMIRTDCPRIRDIPPGRIMARIVSDLSPKPKTMRMTVNRIRYVDGKSTEAVRGKMLLYIQKGNAAGKLQWGDVLIFRADPGCVSPPGNPGEFDYRKYLGHRHIYWTAYADSNAWRPVGSPGRFSLQAYVAGIRKKLKAILDDVEMERDDRDIAAALLLGLKKDMAESNRERFERAGVMHVLAVSGLHVGMICWVLYHVLGLLKVFPCGIYIRFGIMLVFLAFYALLTGLSPSVLRASLMISMYSLARLAGRSPDMINIICGSCLILLLIDPHQLMHAGFQLSYLAVTGIAIYYPRFNRTGSFRNTVLKRIRSITSITLAAQIAAMPLAIHYFGNFPVYFLLSNFLVFLLVPLVLYCGALFLILSLAGFPWMFAGKLFKVVTGLLKTGVDFAGSVPGAEITGISLGMKGLILVYGIIVCMSIFFFSRKFFFLVSGLLFVLVFLMLQLHGRYRAARHARLPGTTAKMIGNKRLDAKDYSYKFASNFLTTCNEDSDMRSRGSGVASCQNVV